jgi:hypothetical protein
MVKNFVCEVCSKCFNTTQHLNQHKNKKKKCVPVCKPLMNNPLTMNNQSMSLNYVEKNSNKETNEFQKNISSIPGIINFTQDNLSQTSSTEYLLNSLIGHSDNFSYNSKNSSNSTINTNSDISTSSIPGLVDIFINYKTVLDENKKLNQENLYLMRQVNKLKNENSFLKAQTDLVDSFITSYQHSNEKNIYNSKHINVSGEKNYRDVSKPVSDLGADDFNDDIKF